MKYNFITRQQVAEAFTSKAKEEIVQAARDMDGLPSRGGKLFSLPGFKVRFHDETLNFLHVVEKQEEQHEKLVNGVMAEIPELAEQSRKHDCTKDDLFLFLVPAYFTGAAELKTLAMEEIGRHHSLEPHHPEYEIYHPTRSCTDTDILEMAIDRLGRNAQFGDGIIRLDDVKKYLPAFPRDNERKRTVFWKYAETYKDRVQSVFDWMFGMSDESKCSFDLGDNKVLSVGEWDGDLRVDLRQWWPTLTAEKRPSRRGVSFHLERYAMLRMSKDSISEALTQVRKGGQDIALKCHVGGNVYATVDSPYACVNIRQWYKKDADGDLLPGKGLSLTGAQWDKYLEADQKLDNYAPELASAVPCLFGDDHQNQEGWLMCPECNPNGLFM